MLPTVFYARFSRFIDAYVCQELYKNTSVLNDSTVVCNNCNPSRVPARLLGNRLQHFWNLLTSELWSKHDQSIPARNLLEISEAGQLHGAVFLVQLLAGLASVDLKIALLFLG